MVMRLLKNVINELVHLRINYIPENDNFKIVVGIISKKKKESIQPPVTHTPVSPVDVGCWLCHYLCSGLFYASSNLLQPIDIFVHKLSLQPNLGLGTL